MSMFDGGPGDDLDGYDGVLMDPECNGYAPEWQLRQDPGNYMECGCYAGGPCPHQESYDQWQERMRREKAGQ